MVKKNFSRPKISNLSSKALKSVSFSLCSGVPMKLFSNCADWSSILSSNVSYGAAKNLVQKQFAMFV